MWINIRIVSQTKGQFERETKLNISYNAKYRSVLTTLNEYDIDEIQKILFLPGILENGTVFITIYKKIVL